MADLTEYRRKRNVGQTPEPIPEDGPLPHGDNDVFVIHEHHARRLHHDVRLEHDGVLVSWAVPKGLPKQAGPVRLAVQTEDHPLEYAGFHGEIPKGQYGAGQVVIWDRGNYETVKWTSDEIEVALHGKQVDGNYVFVHKSDDWLVRKRGQREQSSPPVTVEVQGRRLRLTNLDKVLYPSIGFTKAEVIDYYQQIAAVLLPHVADRPVTLRRFPNGVEENGFFEKNVSKGAPEWLRTMRLPTPGSSKGREYADYVMLDDVPGLVWAANLAGIELHVPQWTVGPRGGHRTPDLLVFDLDPGAPATIVECCQAALLIRDAVAEDGLTVYAKTSGSKGLQLYAPVQVSSAEQTSAYAKSLAERLALENPRLLVAVMTKSRRTGRILIDWSQNNPAKTTIAPYSLRARPMPTVSTPVTWDEVAQCATPEDLMFTADDVLARVAKHGDLFAQLHQNPASLPRN